MSASSLETPSVAPSNNAESEKATEFDHLLRLYYIAFLLSEWKMAEEACLIRPRKDIEWFASVYPEFGERARKFIRCPTDGSVLPPSEVTELTTITKLSKNWF